MYIHTFSRYGTLRPVDPQCCHEDLKVATRHSSDNLLQTAGDVGGDVRDLGLQGQSYVQLESHGLQEMA